MGVGRDVVGWCREEVGVERINGEETRGQGNGRGVV